MLWHDAILWWAGYVGYALVVMIVYEIRVSIIVLGCLQIQRQWLLWAFIVVINITYNDFIIRIIFYYLCWRLKLSRKDQLMCAVYRLYFVIVLFILMCWFNWRWWQWLLLLLLNVIMLVINIITTLLHHLNPPHQLILLPHQWFQLLLISLYLRPLHLHCQLVVFYYFLFVAQILIKFLTLFL